MKSIVFTRALAGALALTGTWAAAQPAPDGLGTPSAPATRNAPAIPGTPATPSAPAIPSSPAAPSTPAAPSAPAAPSTSAGPSTPRLPTTPGSSSSPVAPAAPPGAVAPATPPAQIELPPAAVDDMPNPVEDAMITAKIKSSLVADAATRTSNIDVDTRGGIVILEGTVVDDAQARRAIQIARATEGVRSVTNNLRRQ